MSVNSDKKPLASKAPPTQAGICTKILDAIWSVRYKHKENAVSKELYLRTTIRNFVMYLIFLVAVTAMNFGMISLIRFYFADTMTKLFLDSPLSDTNRGTFRSGMMKFDDIWDFMENTLPQGLYSETWYDLNDTDPNNLGYLLYQNRLLGTPRLSQSRIPSNSCEVPTPVKNITVNCFSLYDTRIASKQPFGKANLKMINASDITYDAWFYSEDIDSGNDQATLANYPSGGYSINLGNVSADTLAIIADLKANKWIDLNTRLIKIEFTVYNGNVNLFLQIKLLMEIPPTGGIITSWSFSNLKLLRYVTGFDYFIMACEIIFVIYILYFTIEEILDIVYNKFKYFMDVYNLLDIVIIILSYIVIPLSLYRNFKTTEILDKILADVDSFQNFNSLSYMEQVIDKINAIILFFAWLKIFKFVVLNRTLDQLNKTLGHSAKDVMNFLVIFFIVFFAYGISGYLLFGEILEDYQSFSKTLFTLFRIILGDFNFLLLRRVAPIYGPLFFVSYVFFCFFVLMNMFVAIISDSYTSVKEENARLQAEFALSDFLKLNYSRIADKLNLRKNRILDINEVIRGDELSKKKCVDFETWRKELRKKGYADMEIEAIFSKYDKDGDRVLNERERFKLIIDVNVAKNNLRKEFKDFKETRKDNVQKNDELVTDSSVPTNNNDGTNKDGQNDNNNERRTMSRYDFEIALERVNRTEMLIATVIQKIDKIFHCLEDIECKKLESRIAKSPELLENNDD